MNKCPISGYNARVFQKKGGSRIYFVECELTGNYSITRTAKTLAQHLDNEQRIRLIWQLRNNYENGYETQITSDNLKTLPESIEPSFDPLERVDRILIYIFKQLTNPADSASFDVNKDYPIAYAENQKECAHYLQLAKDLGYVDFKKPASIMNKEEVSKPKEIDGIRPTIEGWKHYENIKNTQAFSDQAFVAMWFGEEMKNVWSNGFKKALEDTGYSPLRIDIAEHNEKICDRINIEIRRSSLLIADFTENRGGVYFEAGFALGLNIPVIWTCRNDFVEKLHFDTRQYNHIVWKDSEELYEKLTNRIRATIPGKLNSQDA